MNTTQNIKDSINRMPNGHIFTVSEMIKDVSKAAAVQKTLTRLENDGKISRLSKGKYYKPEKTPFGTLQPAKNEVIKDLLKENGKITGYLTGLSVYSEMGLTTQVSNTLQIGRKTPSPQITRSIYTISFITQKNNITRENIPLLQILDAVRYIKKIPGTTVEQAGKQLKIIIKTLPPAQKIKLAELAKKYPPAARAYTGAILEAIGARAAAAELLRTLNPLTVYKIPGIDKKSIDASKWHII